MTIGVLAFHGDFAEHLDVLNDLGVTAIEVRSLKDLEQADKLIIPGGESTVMAKFLKTSGIDADIIRRVSDAKYPLSVYGTCAGAILLAKRVTGKLAPKTLGLIDIDVERNAYGSQVDSFEATLMIKGISEPVMTSFIRAPVITRVGKDVEILAEHDGKPVLVRQGNVLAGTFHPEVRGQTAIHEMFLGM